MMMRLFREEAGATAIEYGLIGGLVAVAIAAALANLGVITEALYTVTTTLVEAAIG